MNVLFFLDILRYRYHASPCITPINNSSKPMTLSSPLESAASPKIASPVVKRSCRFGGLAVRGCMHLPLAALTIMEWISGKEHT